MRRSTAYSRNTRRNRSSRVYLRDKVVLTGGLNLVHSALKIKPGELLVAKNYEPYFIDGAYRRVGGFERFDGRPQPHKAEYWKVSFTGINNGPFVVGDPISSETGEAGIVARYQLTDAEGNGYFIVTDLTDNVINGVVWTQGGTTATATSSADYEGELDEDQHDLSILAAENIRRDLIEKVGGAACTGPCLGVQIYKNSVYAFRNNLAETEATMWEKSDNGWIQIDTGYKVRFEAGTNQIYEGDNVIGATSTAACTVGRVVLTNGYWSGDDAEGYFITKEVSGGSFNNSEDLEVGGVVMATTTSIYAQDIQTLQPGGDYKFRNYNFGGHAGTHRMYGVSGVDYGFEFDGSLFVQIETGMTNDTPEDIGVHRGHLMYSFSGGSLQLSGKNDGLSFTPVTGANELLAGDEITGFIEEIGDSTFVFTRSQTYVLTGFVQENISLKLHNFETGALKNTMQRIGRTLYLDDRGFTQLPATDKIGDFSSNQVSMKVDPMVQDFLRDSLVTKSTIHKGKSLYRCFFDNREAVVIGFSGNKVNGITTIDYGKQITAAANGEIHGQERVFIGDDEGYVFETDVGRNFDGGEVEAYVVTAYHFAGNPEVNKRWRDMVLYIEGDGRTSLTVSADYNYNEAPQNFETLMDRAEFLGGGRYGISRHGDFIYSAASKTDIRVPMNSHARNASFIMYHRNAAELPHILYSMQFHVSQRRVIRR